MGHHTTTTKAGVLSFFARAINLVSELRLRLTPLIRKTQPYAERIAHKATWVEPELLAEIECRAKSAEGKVRHPFFKGLRDDV